MREEIIAHAPTRVDLIGGTLDIWPIYSVLPSAATINIGIPLFARVKVRLCDEPFFHIRSLDQGKEIRGHWQDVLADEGALPLAALVLREFWREDLPGLDIEMKAESPQGAGVGGSSSLAICLAGALSKVKEMCSSDSFPAEEELVRVVTGLETRLLHTPTGTQDHWAALRGGLNLIRYSPGGPLVETIRQDPFQDSPWSMILCDSGKSRCSGINNWHVFRAFFDGDVEVVAKFQEIARLSTAALAAAERGQMDGVLELSHQEWLVRKTLAKEIETDESRYLDQISQQEGALFSRICGAGGGGVMAIFVPKEREASVRARLGSAGARLYPSEVCIRGLVFSEKNESA
ncbi:MAG: hypothetical protein H6618_00590 [Deltaproteobacteria bacterium]|nr:hypothetical protein [Deltaproteobacteria bacterium]